MGAGVAWMLGWAPFLWGQRVVRAGCRCLRFYIWDWLCFSDHVLSVCGTN